MTKREDELKNLYIPPEKAAVIARVDEMKAGGWEALKSMSYEELAELEAEIDDSFVFQGKILHGSARFNEPLHPHNQSRRDGLSAIIKERKRREDERTRNWKNQFERANLVSEVCDTLAEIAEKLDRIASIEPDYDSQFCKVLTAPVLDVATASDGALNSAAHECRHVIGHTDPQKVADQAKAISIVKGKTASAVAASLADRADAMAKERDKALELLNEIDAEKKRREDERIALQESMSKEAMAARIAQLEKQLEGATEQ